MAYVEEKVAVDKDTVDKAKKMDWLENDGETLNDKGNKGMQKALDEEINKQEKKQEEQYVVTTFVEPWRKLEFFIMNQYFKDRADKEKKTLFDICITRIGDQYCLHPAFHLFKINEELNSVFLNTNNEIFFRKLPFKDLILDCDFLVGKKRIQGIMIREIGTDDMPPPKKNSDGSITMHPPEWMIYCLECPHDSVKGIEEWKAETMILHEWRLNTDFKKGFEKTIFEYVCNFLDFLGEPDVSTSVVQMTEKQMKKRAKRGKAPNPSTVYVKVVGELRKYLDSVREGVKHSLGCSFWFRGHWRHFKSERYKEKKGTKKWVKPFIKGKSILIKKSHTLTGDKQ